MNQRTEIKFLIMLGATKTLLRVREWRGIENEYEPIEVMGSRHHCPQRYMKDQTRRVAEEMREY